MKRKAFLWLVCLLCLGSLVTYLLAQSSTSSGSFVSTELRPNPDGSLTVRFASRPGVTYRIESSADMTRWETAASAVVATENRTDWTDARGAASGQRFYRVTELAQSAARAQVVSETERLLAALEASDDSQVVAILRANGVSETALKTLSSNLARPPQAVALSEPFFRGAIAVPIKVTEAEARARLAQAEALGFGRRFWVVKQLPADWEQQYDNQRALLTADPVGALDLTLNDTNLIAAFRWYDRYADGLHSVVLNWTRVSNHTETGDYAAVNRMFTGLHRLLKARKPEAFVWLGVVKKDDRTDEQWLRAMTFEPDGLLIWNLRQFHSPFAETRERYVPIVGADRPMVIAGFYGYKSALAETEKQIQSAKDDMSARTVAETRLKGLGELSGSLLQAQERELQQLGYRGWTLHGSLIEAVGDRERYNR